jgi:glycosyltransferase involved in cell wall biosynthesis
MLDTWTPPDGLPTVGGPSWLTNVDRGEPAPPRRRSVCLYTPSVDPSGMGAHMIDLAAEYVRDHDVTVMAWPTAPGQRLLDRAAAVGARAVALRHPRDPRFAEGVVRSLREHPVDVFHVHVGTGRENFDGARAARRAGVPAVVQTQHLPWLLASRKHRVPFFRALQPVDHLITVSLAQRQTYERNGVAPGLMTTIPNGIRARGPGAGRDAARVALGLDRDQPVVLTVGRLTVMKGQRHLVDAVPELARRFGGVAVVVIGQGHLHAQLRAQAQALGVADRVHLVGHRADARMLLDAADVFVLPSRHEGMPLVLLEAMDAGLPVVATRVIGSEEVVADGETGLLVRPQDPAALAAAIGRLLEDPALRQRYGRAGRRRYLERFTSARMAVQTAEVYDHVLRERPVAVASGG